MNKNKKILIKTDGNNVIGMGHLYRCIILAKELKKRGFEINFLIPKNKLIEKKIGSLGICNFTNNNQNTEINIIRKINPDIILIDLLKKYFLYNEKFWTEIKTICKLLITIDFNGKELKYVDLAFNPLFNTTHKAKKNFSEIKYCPIRKEYQKERKKFKISKKVKSILILQGGADTKCFIPKIINVLKKIPNEIKITVVIGSAFKCKKEMNLIIKKNEREVTVLQDIKNMASIMKNKDIIITSAGVTLIEILTIGVPSIIITGDKHELENANRIANKKAAISLGYVKNVSQKILYETVEELIQNYNKRKALSRNAQKISDGKGLERIIKIIEKKI